MDFVNFVQGCTGRRADKARKDRERSADGWGLTCPSCYLRIWAIRRSLDSMLFRSSHWELKHRLDACAILARLIQSYLAMPTNSRHSAVLEIARFHKAYSVTRESSKSLTFLCPKKKSSCLPDHPRDIGYSISHCLQLWVLLNASMNGHLSIGTFSIAIFFECVSMCQLHCMESLPDQLEALSHAHASQDASASNDFKTFVWSTY